MVERTEEIPDQNYQTHEADDNILNELMNKGAKAVGNMIPPIETKDKLAKKKEELTEQINRLKKEADELQNTVKQIEIIESYKNGEEARCVISSE